MRAQILSPFLLIILVITCKKSYDKPMKKYRKKAYKLIIFVLISSFLPLMNVAASIYDCPMAECVSSEIKINKNTTKNITTTEHNQHCDACFMMLVSYEFSFDAVSQIPALSVFIPYVSYQSKPYYPPPIL